jgi:hypothetical protein
MMMRVSLAVLAVLLLVAPAARAQEPAPATPPSDAPMEPGAAAPQEPSLDFDLLGPAAPPADVAQVVDPELERKLHRRRTMLQLHQGLGFAMAAGLTPTVVMGQIQLNDSFRGGEDHRKLLPWHRGFAIGTTALFFTVGALGVLAPSPYEKEPRWDTVRFHKLFMALATVGMLTQVVLGTLAVDNYGNLAEPRLATAHQIVGYTTLGLVAAGMVSLAF